ncbi:MAG TPA: ABC transporter permease, partial [Nevskiaceae bacterium]|nr:ABC transporter permease [Nevskiaceae bacterium]
AGRMFTPGLREVIAGKAAQQQFQGVELGRTLKFRGSEWTVVGTFSTDGDAHETELWTDLDTARGAFGRPGASSVLARLTAPAALGGLQKAMAADPRFQLDAQSEKAYYAAQSEGVTQNIGIVTSVVTTIMALGALFGALNTMYSAVSTRQVEIATLRAIGFSSLPVVVSVLSEAVLLAVAGGLLGAAVAWLAFNGMTVTTLAGGSFTQVAFSFLVTPGLIGLGLGWAVSIGFIGGLLPAIRAARLPVVDALRAA